MGQGDDERRGQARTGIPLIPGPGGPHSITRAAHHESMMRRPFICCSPSLPHVRHVRSIARPLPQRCFRMPDRRCCACIFPRRSVRCLPGSARTAVGGRRDGCPGPSNSPSSVHRQRTGSRRSAPSIPTGHKKVFPIPGGHKKSVLFQGRFPAVWTGLEPATPCVTGRYSNQLNYHTVLFADANIGIFHGTANIRAIISQLFSHFLPGAPASYCPTPYNLPLPTNRQQ